MLKVLPFTILGICCTAFIPAKVCALTMTAPHPTRPAVPPAQFTFKDASGKEKSVDVVSQYRPDKITRPLGKPDRTLDPKLMRAATIAEERADARQSLKSRMPSSSANFSRRSCILRIRSVNFSLLTVSRE